jgi:hypothetical protein
VLQRWCLILLLGFAGVALTHPVVAKGGHGHGRGDGKSAGKTDGKTPASKSAPGKGIKTAPHTPAGPGGAASKGDTNPPPSEASLGKDTNKFPDKVPGRRETQSPAEFAQLARYRSGQHHDAQRHRHAGYDPEPVPHSMLGAGGEHVPNALGSAVGGPKPAGCPLQHPVPLATAGLRLLERSGAPT